MTAYISGARSTYVSINALIVMVGVSLTSGVYTGAVAAAWLIALGYPLRWCTVPAAFATLAVWTYAMRLWWQTVRQIESDAYSMAAGQVRYSEPLVIEHTTQTGGGQVTQRVKAPATPDQVRLAAGILLPLNGRFNLRSIYSVFGQAGAVKFRDWLVGEGYAVMNEYGQTEMTEIGMVMLRKSQGSPTPLMGEMVHYKANRPGYTHNTHD